ncbi:GGDEF domain-containing sensory box protein [Legionella rubrilucens]|uniref:GGDEF domain-containing sensory box protein n=1 Tax=Legionella rubrilucens TaxID=458 RepID=A0A0W0XQZ3_9GAMM|nr:EAL domain-containing protein [Legionella rubrilucens]KTD47127.1 GGDEF domain-containing sensory box protein [Legionella rubrilucens]
MGNTSLIIEEAIASEVGLGNFASRHDLSHAIQLMSDSIFVLDKKNKILFLNEMAAHHFLLEDPGRVLGQTLQKAISMRQLGPKQLFTELAHHCHETQKGVPQQFTWVEEKDNHRPSLAFNVMVSTLMVDKEPNVLIKLVDITESKMLEWVLRSLAEIANHGGINDVIDDVTKLASDAFNADHACVDLIDSDDIAHSVSYYYRGIKRKNVSYALQDTPCKEVKESKSIHHFDGDVQERFPKDILLQEMSINSYIGGPLLNSEGAVVGLLVLLSEKRIILNHHSKTLFRLLSERICLEIERLLSQRKLQFLASIPHQDPNPVFRIQYDGNILYSNSSGREILDYWYKGSAKLPLKLQDACLKAKQKRDVVRMEMEVKDKMYLFTVVWIQDFDQINVYATDITELKMAQQKMRDLASYDPLTNVGNRQFFETTLDQWMEKAKKNKEELALLLIDVDNFKTINDTLGHHVGDQLLRNLAKRMSGCIRKTDFIARLGGDEFVVLLKLTEQTDIEKIAGKINQALSTPFEIGEYHLETGCSIGICYYPTGGQTANELLRNADTAMYRAKKNGKNQYTIFSNATYNEINSRLILLKRDLRQSIAKNEFYIDYQPMFDLKTNEIVSYEAFIRWRHPKKGLISPSEFIPLAEQTGCIQSLGYWTIQQALKDFAAIIAPLSDAKIALNIALSQLNDQYFIDNLCDSLLKANIPARSVILDIAEQISSLQYRHLDANLEALRSEGICLSLDNFGTEHSNVSRLLETPFDYVKIDHSLLHSLALEPKRSAFISGLIELAHKLELTVIQKGVENAEQNQLLKQLGCRYAQGFYYCRPLPIETLKIFINDYNNNYQA